MTDTVLSLGTYSGTAVLTDAGVIELTMFVSTDRGPALVFRPCLTVPLSEGNATELLGTLAIALQDMRERRGDTPIEETA